MSVYDKSYQQCEKEWIGWCALKDVPINSFSAPNLADFFFWFTYLGLDCHGTVGIYCSAISALEHHYHHQTSNHHIIFKLTHHLYYSTSLHVNSLIYGMSYVILNITVKCCSDLTLLCIAIQHFFFSIMLMFLFLHLVVR